MSDITKADVGHRHTASDVRGGKFPIEMMPDGVVTTSTAASTTAAGIVELATNTETQTGTDATRAVTPAGLASVVSAAAWTAYTPVLTAATTNPNLGSTGVASGGYTRIGKTVHWRAYFEAAGTGVSAGSGAYKVSLPVTPASSAIVGVGWIYGAIGFRTVTLDANTISPARLIMADGTVISHTQGLAAVGHVLQVGGTYEGA